jgi:S-adenosylmethionine hydrolase
LSRGVPPTQFGPRLHELVQLEWPELVKTKSGLRGEVVYIDRFGNCLTNLPASRVLASGTTRIKAGARLIPIQASYSAVKPGKPVAVIGSSGLLEIAVNGGSAAKKLGIKSGARVVLPGK